MTLRKVVPFLNAYFSRVTNRSTLDRYQNELDNLNCPGLRGFSVQIDLLKESNAENKTTSLNTWRGNKTQILIHCVLSLKGVYT